MASNPQMNAYLAGVIQQTMPDDNTIRTGEVVSIDGLTLGVLVNGGVIPCGFLATFTPQINQTVALLRQGADWLVLGPTAGPASPPEMDRDFVSETKVVLVDTPFTGTAYTPDPYLFVDLPSSGWFGIELVAAYLSPSAAINTRFTFPSLAVAYNASFFYDAGATPDMQQLISTTSPGITIGGFPASGSSIPIVLRGSLKMNGYGGRLQWTRGQVTAVGTSTIAIGSYLKVWRMNYREEH
jgi:ABC-type sugar transport system substrate-binding protein